MVSEPADLNFICSTVKILVAARCKLLTFNVAKSAVDLDQLNKQLDEDFTVAVHHPRSETKHPKVGVYLLKKPQHKFFPVREVRIFMQF